MAGAHGSAPGAPSHRAGGKRSRGGREHPFRELSAPHLSIGRPGPGGVSAFRPANERLCYQTANDLHQLFELILEQFAVGDVANATQETLPTTPQVFPDRTVVYGDDGFTSIAAR
jgi:hypothetical protein